MRSAIVLVLLAASCGGTEAPPTAPAAAKPYPRYSREVAFELTVHSDGFLRHYYSGYECEMDGEYPSDLPQDAFVTVERDDGASFDARIRFDESTGRALLVWREDSPRMPHLEPLEKVRVVPLGRIPGLDDAPRLRKGASDVVPRNR